MGHQNRIRREAFPDMLPAPLPFRGGILLRFIAGALLGGIGGVPVAAPADGTAVAAWSPMIGTGNMVQAAEGLQPTFRAPGGAALSYVDMVAAKVLAQAANALPVGILPRTLALIGSNFTAGLVVDGQPLLRYGTLAAPGQDFGVGIDVQDKFTGRTATAEQDTTGVAAAGAKVDGAAPALVGIMFDGVTTVTSFALLGTTASGVLPAVRVLDTTVGNPLTIGDANTLGFRAYEIIAWDRVLSDIELDELFAYAADAYGITGPVV
jgi:hypothetical protein